MELLADPPNQPDTSRGYLDLLDHTQATNNGMIQALWASGPGSLAYDTAQGLLRRVMSSLTPTAWLDLPADGVAVDVGCGPGNVTAALAGPNRLAIGVDISAAMLARAVKAEASPSVGFVRADAQRLPFRDAIADGVVSLAALHLIPDRAAALGEMVRVLKPGARLAIMVPTRAGGLLERLSRVLPPAGAHFFTDDEIADTLEQHGITRLRIRHQGPLQWTQGQKPSS